MKICKTCNNLKNINLFFNCINNKHGKSMSCKECDTSKSTIYKRTINGLIGKIYQSQKYASKNRFDNPPSYTREELIEWVVSQDCFEELYNNWIESDYDKMLIPSIDRIDDYKGYSFDNIQLITWKDNNKKGWLDRKNGINNKHNKAVLQYTLDGKFVKEYHSTMEAERNMNIAHENISKNCNLKIKSCGGYIWKYK